MTIVDHPAYLLDRAAMVAIRLAVRSMKGRIAGPAGRASFDALMRKIPRAAGVVDAAATIGGVAGYWCRPPGAPAHQAILYFHGGAYVMGSATAYRNFVGQIAARAGICAFVADYALAPERPFPAAFEDAHAVYDGLVRLGFSQIALSGDSAGGGLALALLSSAIAKAHNGAGQRPAAAAVISPWTDLAVTGASLDTRAKADPFLTRDSVAAAARLYLGDQDPRDPRASPLYAAFEDLPPIRIDVGDGEVLLDDSIRYGDAVAQKGGTVQIHKWRHMVHVFPANLALLRAARKALHEFGDFFRKSLVAIPAGSTTSTSSVSE